MGHHNAMHLQVQNKKAPLVMLYKLWSGFTKNLRYQLFCKHNDAVIVERIGTFKKLQGES